MESSTVNKQNEFGEFWMFFIIVILVGIVINCSCVNDKLNSENNRLKAKLDNANGVVEHKDKK